jgi:uncharacterized protein YbjT (DUF2867 family)
MSENNSTPTTLVTGATGAIGEALTRSLCSDSVAFRVMCRRQEQVEEFTARGVEAVRGDFTDPAGLRAALSGCDQLFLLPPATPDPRPGPRILSGNRCGA